MKIQKITQHKKTKKRHENRDKKIIVDDYDVAEFRQISDVF